MATATKTTAMVYLTRWRATVPHSTLKTKGIMNLRATGPKEVRHLVRLVLKGLGYTDVKVECKGVYGFCPDFFYKRRYNTVV